VDVTISTAKVASALPHFPEHGLELVFQLPARAIGGLTYTRSLFGYDDRIAASETCLDKAPDVGVTPLRIAVLIAEVDLDAGKLVAKSFDGTPDQGLYFEVERVASIDVAVRINLNLHRVFSL